MKNSAPVLILFGLFLPAVAMGATIDLPENQWVAVRGVDSGAHGVYWGGSLTNGLKHVTLAINPDNGKIYFTAGDYSGGPPADTQSYRQETWSLDLAARMATGAGRHVGWTLEYPYCGPSGQVQPKHPDFGGWTWDTKRKVFWWVPGTMEITSEANCPGETSSRNSDPGFILGNLMTFDPVQKRWTDRGPLPASVPRGENWMSHYDPNTDTLVRFGQGDEFTVSIYKIDTDVWTNYRLQTSDEKTIYVAQEYIAWDPVGRRAFMIDFHSARLYSYNIDAHTVTDLGLVPYAAQVIADQSSNHMMVVYDPNNGIVFWYDTNHYRFHAYHVSTGLWEQDLATHTADPTIYAYGRMMVFDKEQNLLFLGGGTADPADKNPGGGYYLQPYFYLYRYGGGAPQAPPSRPRRLRIQ